MRFLPPSLWCVPYQHRIPVLRCPDVAPLERHSTRMEIRVHALKGRKNANESSSIVWDAVDVYNHLRVLKDGLQLDVLHGADAVILLMRILRIHLHVICRVWNQIQRNVIPVHVSSADAEIVEVL